jgi:hypothetical protein
MTKPADDTAATLNRDCRCNVVDLAHVRERLDAVVAGAQPILESHPHLFSAIPVFLQRDHFTEMQRAIAAIETVVGSEPWRRAVLASAPDIARHETKAHGVFFGYDFHIGAEGPRLIEINTNAGGAFLNVAARDAQIACCEAARDAFGTPMTGAQLEEEIVAMFRNEWRLARGDAPLRAIAIVDDEPTSQFLYPEFLLAKRLFESRGITTHIVDTAALRIVDGRVVADGEPIDLVYNRSTDFQLESASSAVLRRAYLDDLAVVTPHPRAHALFANKRNLVWLSDGARLAELGASRDTIEALGRTIPVTREVAGCEETWWKSRKDWFFKPESGFGSRGTYRGDKLTRRVFAEVMSGDYIAQQLTPPGERLEMKADIRCYTYEGRIQLMVARLYQGQTTNFRTAGGGFAPVYVTQ